MPGLHTFDHIDGLQAIDIKHSAGRGLLRRPLGAPAPQPGGALDLTLLPRLSGLDFGCFAGKLTDAYAMHAAE